MSAVAAVTDRLTPLSLQAVLSIADLQSRIDRKYLISADVFARLLDQLVTDLGVLEIDGVRSFHYESVYFDTASLDSYLAAAHGRRRRFKVRTRAYLDSGQCAVEVKTRSGRGETVKERIPYDLAKRHHLDDDALRFVRSRAALPDGCVLRPVLTTKYERSTLVDLRTGGRLTCDTRLSCHAPGGRAVSLPDELLVETKSPGPVTAADRFLWTAGCRPVPISKYCIGMAALDPTLPANKWNRVLRRHFTQPATV